MDKIHCYNKECINGREEKNCLHDADAGCIKNLKYTALVPQNPDGTHDSYYCSRECKAKVVMAEYNPITKPRSVEEMQYRIKRMKERAKLIIDNKQK